MPHLLLLAQPAVVNLGNAVKINSNLHPALFIRRAVIEDSSAIKKLIIETALLHLRPHYTAQQWQVFKNYYALNQVRAKLQTQHTWLAFKNTKLVGTVSLANNLVVGFYTHHHYMRLGIGTALMQQLIAHATSNNLEELKLLASPVGIAYYCKHGWQIVEATKYMYMGVAFDETLMRLKLPLQPG